MVVGLILNWALALYTLMYAEEEHIVEVDIGHLILTIPLWPLTLWQVIKELTQKDDTDGN